MKIDVKPSRCIALAVAGLLLTGLTAVSGETAKPVYSGSVRAMYDYRGLGSYEDHDAYAYWYLRGSDLAEKHLNFYTSGRFQEDLDGTGVGIGNDPFIGLTDTARNDGYRLLQLYLELHDKDNDKALRAGRQYVDVADYIQMDGLQAMLYENRGLGGRVFFGLPVSYYSSVSDDLFGGVSLTGKPWKGNRSRATYARYEDDSERAADDHVFLDTRQQMTETLRTRAYLSLMNGDVRMGGADLYYMSFAEKAFDAVIGARRWGDYDANTRVYSPLVQALGEQEPYTTAYGRFTTPLLAWLYLSPGAYLRYPDESNFTNRGYERYDLSLIYEPFDAFNASVALEYWDVEDEDCFLGLSGDLRYRHRKLWEVSLGAAYLDYTYFQFSDFSLTADGGSTIVGEDGTRMEVSPYAFTYFLRGKWNLTKHTALRVSGEIEDDSDQEDLAYRIRTSFEVRL